MSEKFSPKKFLYEHRRDLMLILSLVSIAAILSIILALTSRDGGYIKVEINGKEIARYSLDEDGEYPIGEGNVLAIEDGEAYMKYADCPDGTCVRTGRISKRGQTIICLPNKVAVTVVDDGAGGADMVS